MNDRQLGRFFICNVRGLLREAQLVLSGLVVVRAEMMYEKDGIEYTALGDAFDPVADGEEIPWYVPLLQYDGMGGVKLGSWQRINSQSVQLTLKP